MKKYEVMMINTFVFESESRFTDWEVSNHVHDTILKAIRQAVDNRNATNASNNSDSPQFITRLRHQHADTWSSRVVYPTNTHERVGLMSRLNFSSLRPSVLRDNWNNYTRHMAPETVREKYKRFQHLFENDEVFATGSFPKATYKVSSEVFSSIVENAVSKIQDEVEQAFIVAVLEHHDGAYEDGVDGESGE